VQQQAAPVFTQEQLTATAAREAAEAKRQALREVAERLGCTIEEAEQMLKDARDADASRLSELDKKERDLLAREAKAKADSEAAAKVLRDGQIRDALLDANVKRERLAHATRSIEIPDDADEKAIKEAVKAYAGEVPEWFDASANDPNDQQQQQAPPGTPPSTPTPQRRPAGKPDEGAFDRGAARARALGGIPDAAATAGGTGPQ
jgi:hypothetical protein